MDPILQGMLVGAILVVMIGPVFFSLIQTGMNQGVRFGWAMATGVIVSDTIYVLITYLGISRLLNSPNIEMWLSLGGSIILFVFGLKMVIKPNVITENIPGESSRSTKIFKKFVSGFLLNGINPFVMVFWITVASAVSANFNYTGSQSFRFYFTILCMVYVSDLLKVYTAKKLRNIITLRYIALFNRIAGILLIIFGIRLLYFALS